MAGRGRSCAWVLLVWLTVAVDVAVGAHHQVAAPAPAVDCSSALLGLSDCLTFVEEGSTEVKPQKGCCAGLKKVVKGGQVSCLCDAFKQGASFGVKLNMTKALALPSACGISTPHLSNCNIVLPGSPGASPAPSPNSGAASGVGIAPSPSAGHTGAAAALYIEPVGRLMAVAVALFFCYLH